MTYDTDGYGLPLSPPLEQCRMGRVLPENGGAPYTTDEILERWVWRHEWQALGATPARVPTGARIAVIGTLPLMLHDGTAHLAEKRCPECPVWHRFGSGDQR